MIKSLFILAAAALTLASCSNDETTAINESVANANEISFRSLVNNVTRSTDVNATTLQTSGFTAYAYVYNSGSDGNKYFPEISFTYNSGTYTSATKYYWPSSGSLNFYAYAKNGSSTVTHTADTKVFTITPASAASDQSDFVFACTENKAKSTPYSGGTYGSVGVPLNFRHAMSKITIKFKNSNTTLNATLGNVTIGNIYTKGTFTYSGSTDYAETPTTSKNTETISGSYLKFDDWTEQNTSGNYTQTPGTTFYTSSTSTTALPQSFILIPQTLTNASTYSSASSGASFDGAYIKALIKLQNTTSSAYVVGGDGSNYAEVIWPLPAIKWKPGFNYIYTVDLAGGGYSPTNVDDVNPGTDILDPILGGAEIKFVNVKVDSWTDSSQDIIYANYTFNTGTTILASDLDDAITGTYSIKVSGLTSGETVSVSATGNFSSPSVSPATVGSDGIVTVSANLSAATTATTSTVILTGSSSGSMTFSLNQVAP